MHIISLAVVSFLFAITSAAMDQRTHCKTRTIDPIVITKHFGDNAFNFVVLANISTSVVDEPTIDCDVDAIPLVNLQDDLASDNDDDVTREDILVMAEHVLSLGSRAMDQRVFYLLSPSHRVQRIELAIMCEALYNI